jgi:hypothetical protein
MNSDLSAISDAVHGFTAPSAGPIQSQAIASGSESLARRYSHNGDGQSVLAGPSRQVSDS